MLGLCSKWGRQLVDQLEQQLFEATAAAKPGGRVAIGFALVEVLEVGVKQLCAQLCHHTLNVEPGRVI